VLKIFNLNGRMLQIRSNQMTTSTSTKQSVMRFELSKFQSGTLKLTCNSRVHEPQICIVNHDHSAVTHGLTLISSCKDRIKAISEKKNFQAQDSSSYFHENPCKATYPDCTKYSQVDRLAKKDSLGIDHHLHQNQSRRYFSKTCP
jgi:hypothetical protein